jgi:hypothetical protein
LAHRLRQVNGRAQRAHIFSGKFSLLTVLLLRRTLMKRVSREVLSAFLRNTKKFWSLKMANRYALICVGPLLASRCAAIIQRLRM